MALKRTDQYRVVHSTEQGTMCPGCRQPKAACRCTTSRKSTSPDGVVRVARETKGRKGKGVTLVTGLGLDDDALKTLAKELKKKVSAGGAIKDGVIELQGDHRDAVVAELQERGYKAKKSGG
jgi:translation initiation factor 1